jgi:hypothetical protein
VRVNVGDVNTTTANELLGAINGRARAGVLRSGNGRFYRAATWPPQTVTLGGGGHHNFC